MILKNRLLIGLMGFTLLQAAGAEPKGCSCQSKTESATEKTVSYKGNQDYADGYEHGKKAQAFQISDATEYCRTMRDIGGLMTVPYNPSDNFKAGFNDAYRNRASQY